MSRPRTQNGFVYQSNGAFHIRYYVHEAGVRKQKSRKLCLRDDDHSSKDAASVLVLAEAFMMRINEANGTNDAAPGHNCPLCGNRCPRTIRGIFAKKVNR